MTIDELIAALEKAEGPSRELNRGIAISLGWAFDGNGWQEPDGTRHSGIDEYTSSLDAALTLVPEGCDFGFEVEHVFGGPCVYARCEPNSWIAPVAEHQELVTIQRDTQAEAARMIPIALCIAAFKARRNA